MAFKPECNCDQPGLFGGYCHVHKQWHTRKRRKPQRRSATPNARQRKAK